MVALAVTFATLRRPVNYRIVIKYKQQAPCQLLATKSGEKGLLNWQGFNCHLTRTLVPVPQCSVLSPLRFTVYVIPHMVLLFHQSL